MTKRSPATKHVSTITASGAPAASNCTARICAAPENTIADSPSAPHSDAPAAAAPTPQTRPNGVIATHAGIISANPARKFASARNRRTRYFGGAGNVTNGGFGSCVGGTYEGAATPAGPSE